MRATRQHESATRSTDGVAHDDINPVNFSLNVLF